MNAVPPAAVAAASRRVNLLGRLVMSLEVRRTLTAHPGAVPSMIGGLMDGPQALALNERLLELLAGADLDAADAARAAYLLNVYAFGSIAMEVADLNEVGPMPPERRRADMVDRRGECVNAG